MHFELARFWPAAGRRRLFLINVERRRGHPFFECRDRIRITQVPDILFWIVRWREGIAHLRPSDDADQVDGATRRALGTRGRVLTIDRHESSIDKNDATTGKPRRREHPIAWPFHVRPQWGAGCVNQRLLAIEKLGWKGHAAEFFAILTEPRPAGARRQICWGTAEPRIERRDQIFFPDLAIELPDA